MVNVRQQSAGGEGGPGQGGGTARFNVLLTEDQQQSSEHWTQQLTRLLQPQGVESFLARTGREAVDVVRAVRIHAAVIELTIPTGEAGSGASGAGAARGKGALGGGDRVDHPGGLWLLEVLRRVPNRPPVVVINNHVISAHQAQRVLNDALRLGAFSVVNKPVELDNLLAVIRRLVDRQYRGYWPQTHPPLDELVREVSGMVGDLHRTQTGRPPEESSPPPAAEPRQRAQRRPRDPHDPPSDASS